MELNKEDKMLLVRNWENLKKDKPTLFLDPRETKLLISFLNKQKMTYNLYKPFPDAQKTTFYANQKPEIVLLEIMTKAILTHSKILGSILSEAIDVHLIGDIVVSDKYYFYTTLEGARILEYDLKKIGRENISLVRRNISLLKDYEPNYDYLNLKVDSLRLDLVISKLLSKSRSQVKELINRKEVILNYEVLKNGSYVLKEKDVFSIRRHGKYKYLEISNTTKRNSLIIKLQKYC